LLVGKKITKTGKEIKRGMIETKTDQSGLASTRRNRRKEEGSTGQRGSRKLKVSHRRYLTFQTGSSAR
jgi:hypothetical protein